MLLIDRSAVGQGIRIDADRLAVETTGNGPSPFHGPRGSLLELPARKVDRILLADEAWPYRATANEKT